MYNSSKQSLELTHDITLTAVNNLGYLQFNQGNFDAAVKTLRLVVEDSKAALGENHPGTLVCMSSLTDALQSQGDLESAEHYGRLTLSGREELYGKDYLETLESQYILAQVFLQLERYKEAEQAHNQVLRRHVKAPGAHHPHTFESMAGLAWALFHEKRCAPALAGRERLLGKDHPDYFRSVYLSARLQHVKKEYSRAEPMYRKVCGGFERVLGAEHASFSIS
jgi:tetratricopeptide (TPR) repeat protein